MEVKKINLSSKTKDAIMLGSKRLIDIQITDGKGPFKRFINKYRRIEKTVSLSVEEIKVPDAIIVKDSANLFTICHGNGPDTSQINFPLRLNLSDSKEPFYIQFNAEQIVDCSSFQNSEQSEIFEIKYKIILRDGNTDEIIDEQCETLEIQFERESNIPEARCFLQSEPLQYKSQAGLQKIGFLSAKLPNALKYAPSVEIRMKSCILDNEGKEIGDFLKLMKSGKAYENVNESNLRTVVQPDGKGGGVFLYDLLVDLDRIVNPMEELVSFTVRCEAEYKYTYQNSFSPFPFPVPDEVFQIAKDKQDTELVVIANMDSKQLSFKQGCWNVPQIQFTSGGLVYPIKFMLLNKATDTSRKGAGLTIFNLRVRSEVDSNLSFYNKKEQSLSINDIVEVRGHFPEMETEDGYFVANGENAHTGFSFSFNPSEIYTVYDNGKSIYDFVINTSLEFDYMEDAFGNHLAEKKHFKGIVVWNLYKKPNPEWLCVDFGTSAIVCHYGRGSEGTPIDLNSARKSVYEKAVKGDNNPSGFNKDEIKDKIESNTPFLSSDILFNDVQDLDQESTTLCSQIFKAEDVKYNRMSVLLSPTEKLSSRNFRRQLPCLKILMGNDFLPENDHYRKFKYRYWDSVRQMFVTCTASEASYSLLRIDNIFMEAYYTLFHYFIQDESIIDRTNKVVLTYPNTYTPRNLITMRTIAERTLPYVREVRFVSESDAVAAYYISHWNEYHCDNDDIKTPENILVYDMGAGTLDLTYLTKRFDESSSKFVLEICGKIGTGRAGNYLDYVIAQILADKLAGEGGFRKSWISTEMTAVEQEVLEARVLLKSIIKTKIKPSLSNDDEIKFSIGNKEFSISPSEILNHKLFVDFLQDTTEVIWNNIRRYVGESSFEVNTVILSGRSLRLKHLQDRIQSLAEGVNAKCIRLDSPVSGELAGQITNRSKTAVVEGARTFVDTYMSEDTPVLIKSRRLHASYGVAYKRTGGTWDYKEILNRNNIPFNTSSNDDFSRPGGPLKVEHTNESDVLRFVQSYLSEEDTKESIMTHKDEFISVMSEIMMNELGGKATLNMDVIVDRNNNVSLYIDGKETPYRPPKGVDLNDIITKRSLWPVSIVNE